MLVSEDVHNFMESVVEEEFDALGITEKYGLELAQDLYCLTLNHLRPKYVRFEIDVRMNMNSNERVALSEQIAMAINKSMEILKLNRRGSREE